ncbi:zn-finger domain-containing protein [Gigaspora margarita]|uniref:Zn-finger domain-containing protein n=1 Tax=Gigaspora margarita TaxID=4874 RepID=A0A8H4AJV9_GIGMA|nr:zn-finger domain-containing protein [Gigaspora margarita]
MIIADWPEATTFYLTYKSTKSKYSFHFCLVKRDNLTNTNLIKKYIELRNHENMQYFYNKNEEQINYIELQYLINWTTDYSRNIPRFPELKIFKNGIQILSKIIANEYHNLMKVIVFVLDNLDISEALNKKLLNLYEIWNNIYIMSRFEEFDDQNLKDFKNLIINWAQQFINIFQTYFLSKLKFPKLYSWVYHTINLIREYGLNGFSTETYESLHKDFVKALYYLIIKQNIEIQIMKMVQRQAIATKLLSSQSKNIKSISPYKFTNLIWTFSLNNAQKFINQKLKDYNSSSKIYFELKNFLRYLTIYFNSTN